MRALWLFATAVNLAYLVIDLKVGRPIWAVIMLLAAVASFCAAAGDA